MDYNAYRASTDRAVRELRSAGIRADLHSLAGGYFGVIAPLDGTYVVLARDLDGAGEWLTWSESGDGRCCDDNAVELGHVRPADYPSLVERGAAAILTHECIRL